MNFFSCLVFAGNLFDIVELWNWFLWLLRCLQLLVLLQNCVSLLELCKMRLYLVLRESKSSNEAKYWSNLLRSNAKLGEADVLEGSVVVEHFAKTIKSWAA